MPRPRSLSASQSLAKYGTSTVLWSLVAHRTAQDQPQPTALQPTQRPLVVWGCVPPTCMLRYCWRWNARTLGRRTRGRFRQWTVTCRMVICRAEVSERHAASTVSRIATLHCGSAPRPCSNRAFRSSEHCHTSGFVLVSAQPKLSRVQTRCNSLDRG